MATIDDMRKALERIDIARTAHNGGYMTYTTFDIECAKFQVKSEDWLRLLLPIVEAARALDAQGGDRFAPYGMGRLAVNETAFKALQTALAGLDGGVDNGSNK